MTALQTPTENRQPRTDNPRGARCALRTSGHAFRHGPRLVDVDRWVEDDAVLVARVRTFEPRCCPDAVGQWSERCIDPSDRDVLRCVDPLHGRKRSPDQHHHRMVGIVRPDVDRGSRKRRELVQRHVGDVGLFRADPCRQDRWEEAGRVARVDQIDGGRRGRRGNGGGCACGRRRLSGRRACR